MAATDVRFGGEARQRLLRGAEVLADAAEAIELPDPLENMGAQTLLVTTEVVIGDLPEPAAKKPPLEESELLG